MSLEWKDKKSMDSLVEEVRHFIIHSKYPGDPIITLDRTVEFFRRILQHDEFSQKETAVSSTKWLSLNSPLWRITRASLTGRLNQLQRAITVYRNITVHRLFSTLANDDDDANNLYDFRTKFLTCDEKRSDNIPLQQVQSRALNRLARDIVYILTDTAEWMIHRSVPLRLLHENAQILVREIEEVRRALDERFVRSGEEFVREPDERYDPSNECGRIVGSRTRVITEHRIDSLRSSVERLQELLRDAPVNAQIRIQKHLHAMRLKFEHDERESIDEWTARAKEAQRSLENAENDRVRLDRMHEAVEQMTRIDEIIRRAISTGIRELTSRTETLRRENDLLEGNESNVYSRIVHEIRLTQHKNTGTATLTQRQLDYVRERVTASGHSGYAGASVAIPTPEILRWQANFCRTQCSNIMTEARTDDSSPKLLLETQTNRTRDRLVAFLFYHGDETFLRDMRQLASEKAWSNPRFALNSPKALRELSPTLSSWKRREAELELTKAQENRQRNAKMYEKFFAIDWSPLEHVSFSVLDIIIELFELRRRHFDRASSLSVA